MTPFDPVGAQEIAERAGVAKDTVWKWRKRHEDFPDPSQLAMGPVWEWTGVAAWMHRNGRLVLCPACAGYGLMGSEFTCPKCDGSGRVDALEREAVMTS